MTQTPTEPVELTADLPRVLLVAGPKCCALFVDGQRVTFGTAGDPDAIDLTPAVRELADLAGVTVIEGCDRRILTTTDENNNPIWRTTLTSVVARKAELAEAKRLRAEAQAAIDQASRIETRS